MNSLINREYDNHIYKNILIDACIVGLDGLLWANTKNLKVEPNEFENLKKIICNKSKSTTSLSINKKIYQITKYDKGFSLSFVSDNEGGTIAKTNLTLIVGIYDKNKECLVDGEKKNQCLSYCYTVVEDLAKYLIKLNF